MPTTRPRHTVTETDELARALDLAASRWPEDRDHRTRLLLRLARDWADAEGRTAAHRRAAVLATAGALPDAYPEGYLDRLRDEWPS